MRRGTIVLVIILIVAAFLLLATVVPSFKVADQSKITGVSVKALYCDSTTATIALYGTRSGILELNGAVIRVGEIGNSGKLGSASWTVSSIGLQDIVHNIGKANITLTVIDENGDRRMGPEDRIEVRRDVTGDPSTLSVSFNIRFAGGQEANCSFTYARWNATSTMVSFIDVGQGDSILITTADSRTVLIDSGPPLAAVELVSYLHNRSVNVIDAFIITHPDADHLGGAAEVLKDFTVRSIYHTGASKNTSAFSSFIRAAQEEGCPVHTAADTYPGEYLNITSSATIEVLNIDPSAPDVNDASIVLEMRTPGKSFLFTGDISSDVESKLIANRSFNLDVDVLKVGHHGSRYSTSNAFLDATSPEMAVICVGANTYGHPTNETLTRLFDHGVTVLRTDRIGTVEITA